MIELILMFAGIALVATGISLAIIKKRKIYHIMTGIGAGTFILSVLLAMFLVVLPAFEKTLEDGLTGNAKSTQDAITEAYNQGYEDGYNDASDELFGFFGFNPFGQSTPEEESGSGPEFPEFTDPGQDDDYFIGDFISDFIENLM